MKILKYKKNKDNSYQIEFDNDLKINLYDDIIIKYNLLINNELSDKEFELITKENDEYLAYYKAIKYINIKLRSEKEIRCFLYNKDFSNTIINKTIDLLNKKGFINNKLYIESYINDQINLGNNGYNKILNSLVNLGFNEIDIKKKLDTINHEVWLEKAKKIIDKKIKTNHTNSSRKIKDKIVYDLINLGYDKEIILDLLDNVVINDDDVLKKDYKRLQEKLSKKYKGKDLNIQLRNKLYQKGYDIELINKYIN